MPEIVITPNGEASSAPGVAVVLPYTAVSGAGKLVTLGLDSVAGITDYFWEILDQDTNATATLNDPTLAAPTFTMTQDVAGTYLLRVTLNGGQYVRRSGIAVLTEVLGSRKPAAGETTEFDVDGWKTAVNGFMDQAEGIAAGTNDPDAIHDNVAGEIAVVTEKVSPVATDLLLIEDSAAANAKKRVQIGNLPFSASDADAIHDNVAGEIVAITAKAVAASTDLLLIEDSAAANVKKKVTARDVVGRTVTAVTSTLNQTAINANDNTQFKLNNLAEDTEIQVPTNGVDGDELILTIENTGGQAVTFAAGYTDLSQIDVPDTAGSIAVVSLIARDYGAGLVWGYSVAHGVLFPGEIQFDEQAIGVDSSPFAIFSYTPPTNNAHYVVEVSVEGIDKTAGHLASYRLRANAYRNGGGTLSLVSNRSIDTYEDDATWAAVVVVSGSALQVQITSDATNNVTWRAVGVIREIT